MKNLMKAEFFKLKKSTGYKVLLVAYLILDILIEKNNIGNSVVYPKHVPAYTGAEWLVDRHYPSLFDCECYGCIDTRYHSFYILQRLEWLLNQHNTVALDMGAIFLFIAFYMKGDFTSQTFYRGLLCGTPRQNTFWAKMIVLFIGIIPMMLMSVLIGTVLWSIHAGFGMEFGKDVVFLIARAFAQQFLLTLMLVSHGVFAAVIAKSQIGAFLWSISTLYLIPRSDLILRFLLALLYLNIGTILITILLELSAAGYIFARYDLR